MMRTLFRTIMLLAALMVLLEWSPIYSFSPGAPFQGSLVYNPYADYDSSLGWKKANFHTHTRARKWFNECEFGPDSVDIFYRRFGYDIVNFSNHMEITDAGLAPCYEHGWNFCKLHNLVFNPSGVNYRDFPLPFLTSQRQYKIDFLAKDADFVFLNHPDRVNLLGIDDMTLLSGYRLLEADCGFDDASTTGSRWDAALSSGHYVPSAISDDLHYPKSSWHFARRCTFLCCRDSSYESVRKSLLEGNFYTLHMPDYGEGDWEEKLRAHGNLPTIESIGVNDSLDVHMTLSRDAASISVIGQLGSLLKEEKASRSVTYRFAPSDSYVRLVARFDDGTVLYTNPFARWNGDTTSGTPYRDFEHPVNVLFTILYSLLTICAAAALVLAAFRPARKK